jgi:hypothetical protein
MDFLLSPPVVLGRGLGFSIIQVGHMEAPEILVVRMAGWSALQLLTHWRSQIGNLVSRRRDRACLVTGLTATANTTLRPTEWWTVYLVDDEARFQYQVLELDSTMPCRNWSIPDEWSLNIPDYSSLVSCDGDQQRISEWIATLNDISAWCAQCDILINAMEESRNDAP